MRIEKQDTRRAEQAVAFEQGFVGFAVCGDIGLQQQYRFEFGFYVRIGKGKALQLLAGDTPVGVEIKHHSLFPAYLGDALIKVCAVLDPGKLQRSRRQCFGMADVA